MSYTEANPVSSFYECKTCGVTISGDNLPDNLVEMIYDHHEGHDFGPASPDDHAGEGNAAVVGNADSCAGVEPSSDPAGPETCEACGGDGEVETDDLRIADPYTMSAPCEECKGSGNAPS